MADKATSGAGGRPEFDRAYETEQTMLTRDNREAKVQAQGTKLYKLADRKNSTESLTGLRRTLPSRAIMLKSRTMSGGR